VEENESADAVCWLMLTELAWTSFDEFHSCQLFDGDSVSPMVWSLSFVNFDYNVTSLGCVECTTYRLLLRMIAVSVCRSLRLSHGVIRCNLCQITFAFCFIVVSFPSLAVSFLVNDS